MKNLISKLTFVVSLIFLSLTLANASVNGDDCKCCKKCKSEKCKEACAKHDEKQSKEDCKNLCKKEKCKMDGDNAKKKGKKSCCATH